MGAVHEAVVKLRAQRRNTEISSGDEEDGLDGWLDGWMDGCLEAGYKDADPAHKSCIQNVAVQEDVEILLLAS